MKRGREESELDIWLADHPVMVMDDAVAFLAKARARYRDRPQVYRRFLDAMQRYGGGALDVAALRAAVQALFAGHPALLKDFDAFVPRVASAGDAWAAHAAAGLGTATAADAAVAAVWMAQAVAGGQP
ncbi:hypothetical protein CHLNCDRAFT_141347 [Chlorella variabilis]|uniref:Histone deacetylase interacting domain-containing protein n=1 Tax=Chlorella variabilis TaxID=554065 RepID=E1ZSP2_CHLVA|nr:hypothetical protein CHLNCDRAFT_141347 [Chlorella variabilis]EFN51139.1 hypothetical protein CHLNCDRAFT_141347 [Chlorella variabilis]|eukprot:XP_005843241.1 hypothetical protein CHLNCDRAFT_141347 [Chlorella variabilis]